MNKEERRRLEARRKQNRAKRMKGAVIGSLTILTPILFYLVMRG